MGKQHKKRQASSDESDTEHDRELKNATATSNKTKHDCFDLVVLLAQDEAEASLQKMLCWNAVDAGISRLIRRTLCCVCGFHATHRCNACYRMVPTPMRRYYCGKHCAVLHKEINCGKARSAFLP